MARMEGVAEQDHLYCVRIGEEEGRGIAGPQINDRNDIEARLFKAYTFGSSQQIL